MYYDEKEYLEAVIKSEEAEAEAVKVKNEVYSSVRGELPYRSITEKDYAIMQKSQDAWEKVIEIARRPLKP